MDWLIIIAIALHMGSLFSTNSIIATLDLAHTTATELEGNPIARALMDNQFYFMTVALSLSGVLIGCYAYLRHFINFLKSKGKSVRWQTLAMYIFAFSILYVALYDFTNDFSILLKLLLSSP
jgi:hypothetical protein